MNKQYDIFISYRREGGKDYARNLTSELISRGFQPFLDFDELIDGKFDKRIMDAIESAPVFLFILSPGCLDRCINEKDWVREEILHALKCNRHIIPVDFDSQFDGFPTDKDFPQDIKQALGQHQFSQIQTETLYRESIEKMVNERIKPVLEEYQREREKLAGTHGAEIHIETDMDCHVQRFHTEMIVAKVDKENVIHLPKGKHKLQFIAVENPNVRDSKEYKVEDVNESDFIEVFLAEKAGIISIEAKELENLKQERDELKIDLAELKQQLRNITASLNKKTIEYDQCQRTSETTSAQLNSTILNLQTQLEIQNKEISTIEEKLKTSESQREKFAADLKVYKDKERCKRQAEAESKAEEKKGMTAAEMNSLGDKYYFGKGATQDYAEAVKWFRKSAEQGDSNGQYNLGVMYKKGLGVTQDYAEAVKWFRKSAGQGNSGAKKNLDRLLGKTSHSTTGSKVDLDTNSSTMINGHEYVDLGLPSGLKWATCNVGASSPEEYGDYFAWGETSPKSEYGWSCRDWSDIEFSKYGTVDGKETLDLYDDAACANWGGSWRMPTYDEQTELREKCKWKWTTQRGHNGYKVTGPNGNSIFLPAAGCQYGSSLYNAGSSGYYWSSSLYGSSSHYARYLPFSSGSVDWDYGNRCYGRSVRPVSE